MWFGFQKSNPNHDEQGHFASAAASMGRAQKYMDKLKSMEDDAHTQKGKPALLGIRKMRSEFSAMVDAAVQSKDWSSVDAHIDSMTKSDMTLPPGAPGHLEPEDGPVFKRKKPPIPSGNEGDAVSDMIGQNPDGVADNHAPNQPW